MWPSSGLRGPDTWGTSLAPISFTCTVTSGPVSWLGVGETIWMRAVVAGRSARWGPTTSCPSRRRSRPRAGGRQQEPPPAIGGCVSWPQTIRRRSPVLGRARRRFAALPAGPLPPPRRRPATRAPAASSEGDDAEDEGGFGRARGAVGIVVGVPVGAGGRRRGGRRGGAAEVVVLVAAGAVPGLVPPVAPGATAVTSTSCSSVLPAGVAERHRVRQGAGLVGPFDLETQRLERPGLQGAARPGDGVVAGGRRPPRRRPGRLRRAEPRPAP